jgi:RNase H-like domain found in reverse transcriptase
VYQTSERLSSHLPCILSSLLSCPLLRLTTCVSYRLSPAEVKYSTGEHELLAIVHALTVWLCYLEGAETFRVVTDHKLTISHLKAITDLDTLPTFSRRQTRWPESFSRESDYIRAA